MESHPGPKNDTTCDSSYWAEPVVRAGEMPKVETEQDRQETRQAVRRALSSGRSVPGAHTFDLSDGYRAIVRPGPAGIFDATIGVGKGDKAIVFDGISTSILKQAVGSARSPVVVRKVSPRKYENWRRIPAVLRERSLIWYRPFNEKPALSPTLPVRHLRRSASSAYLPRNSIRRWNISPLPRGPAPGR